MSAVGDSSTVENRKPRHRRTIPIREFVRGILLILPALALTVGVSLFPIAADAFVSLTDARVGEPGAFVGLKNYADLVADRRYLDTLVTTLAYVAATTGLKLLLGLTLALALARPFPGRAVVTVVLLLPWLYPASLAATSLQWMLNPVMYGDLLLRLDRIDHAASIWLEAAWPLVRIVLFDVWRGTSFVGIFLLVGLNGIAADLFEVASLEGGGAIGTFRLVTFPLLRRSIYLALILSSTATLADFTNLYLLTGGRETTQILGTLAYEVALTRGELGRGAAISLSIVPLVIGVVFALVRLLEREDPS